MKPIEDLICQLKRVEREVEQVVREEECRKKAPPPELKFPGLDLSGFDLSHPETRSQLFHDTAPIYIPAEERFGDLVKNLIVNVKAARVYLQHDAYPQARAHQQRVPRLEAALHQLKELSAEAEVEESFYLNALFLEDNHEEYCWNCAEQILWKTRVGLVFTCLVLVNRGYFNFAYALWDMCNTVDWWDISYFSNIYPYKYYSDEADGIRCCDRCGTLLSYSLSHYGVDEEADHFLSCDNVEMTAHEWYQLHAVFEGAAEHGWTNQLADKLEILIGRYGIYQKKKL